MYRGHPLRSTCLWRQRTCAAVFHLPQVLTATALYAAPPRAAANSRSADIVISRPTITAPDTGSRHAVWLSLCGYKCMPLVCVCRHSHCQIPSTSGRQDGITTWAQGLWKVAPDFEVHLWVCFAGYHAGHMKSRLKHTVCSTSTASHSAVLCTVANADEDRTLSSLRACRAGKASRRAAEPWSTLQTASASHAQADALLT